MLRQTRLHLVRTMMKKFIVTTIPFDRGWNVRSLKADQSGQAIKVYKTHGGFVGFMSETGETDYVMSFMPEYFMLGSLTTVVGFYIGIFRARVY